MLRIFVRTVLMALDRAASERQKLSNRAWWLNVFTGIGAIAGFGGMVVLILTLRDARQSNIDAYRAWLAPTRVQLITKLVAGDKINLELDYANTGKSPATDVIENIRLFYPDKPQRYDGNDFKALVEREEVCKGLKPRPDGGVAYPVSQPYNLVVFSDDPLPQEVVNGTKVLVVEACIAYRTMSQEAKTAICYFYPNDPSTDLRLKICFAGNHAN